MISALLGPLWQYIAGGALAFAGLAAIWFGGRKSAKTDAKIKTLESEVRAYEARKEVERRVATERDARQRLRDDWSE
jgi:hypothetical protein